MLLKQTLERFTPFLEQMKAVSNLYRIRCSTGCTIGIFGGAVAADNFYAGMLLKLGGQGVGGTVGEQIDWLMALKVNQDRAKHLAFAQREVINP